jgi:hypothetical protein
MKPEGSLLCSQVTATKTHLEPDESSPDPHTPHTHTHTASLRSILVSSHLHQGLPSNLFSDFPAKFCMHSSYTYATFYMPRPSRFWIDDRNNIWGKVPIMALLIMPCFLSAVTFPFLDPNTTLFSNILFYVLSLEWRIKFHSHTSNKREKLLFCIFISWRI